MVLNFDGTGPLAGVGIKLGLTSGKVALASNNSQVSGPNSANVLDFVGYGTAQQYEGLGAAPSPTLLTSINRTFGDTNDNDVDFTIGLPSPQATGGVLATSEGNIAASALVKNSRISDGTIILAENVENVKIYSLTGQVVKTVTGKAGSTLNVSNLPKGNYIISGTVNNKQTSQKIMKD